MNTTRTILSTNLNGSSDEKVQRLKNFVVKFNIWAVLIQEYKSSEITEGTLAAFPPEKWEYRITPFKFQHSQGLLSLVKREKDIQVRIEDFSVADLLLHKINISTEAASFSYGNFYVKPSLDLNKASTKNIFFNFLKNSDFSYGDYNHATANRSSLLDDFLSLENRLQIIEFPTFKKPGQISRSSTLTDIIVSKPDFTHAITDTNTFIGDHVIILDQITFKTSLDNKSKKADHFFLDSSLITKEIRSNYWQTMPSSPSLEDLTNLTSKFIGTCRTRKKPFQHEINLEFMVNEEKVSDGDESEIGGAALSKFWSNVCEETSSLYDIGKVFEIIKTFSTGLEIPLHKSSIYTRNQLKKSFEKYKSRVTTVKKLTKDQDLKYLRICRNAASRFRKGKTNFAFSSNDIITELKAMNKNAASGSDLWLHSFFPEITDSSGIEKLTKLLNNLIFEDKNGIYIPENLKKGMLTFIPKSENSGETRPLLLNSRVLALLDRLVNQILLKLINNSKNFENRHAFRPYRGVENAIDQILHFVESAKQNKEQILLFQGDLSNAFNGCSHRLIILRVYDLICETGFKYDNKINWVILYLKSWASREVHFEKTSFRLLTGVPQGSPLSPSVFSIVFCWDYKDGRVATIFFADDLTIIIAGNNWIVINLKFSQILSNLEIWCDANDFQLNEKKSKLLVIGDQKKVEIPENFKKLEIVNNLRILGIIFDSNFNFVWHVRKIENYMNKRIIALARLRKLGLDEKCLRAAALCLRSKLAFGLYQNMILAKTNFQKLENLWIKVIRAWTGATEFVPIQVMLEESGMCTFRAFVNYLLMCRFIKGAKLLPIGCFEPTLPLQTELPESPKFGYSDRILRASTVEKSINSRSNEQERLDRKMLKKSELFLSEVTDAEKEIFSFVWNDIRIDRMKSKLKSLLKINRKGKNIKVRKKIFDEFKNSKIEKYNLEKYRLETRDE